jgi:D-arabinitol dehydrogenase (NADP+)
VKAIVYDRPEHFTFTDVPDPEPGPGEVRLRVRASGVCGTDVHLHHGEFSPRYPFTPGHEVVGEVDLLGDGATGLSPGQLVALDNRVFCGSCGNCGRGMPAFCTDLRDLGVTDPGGAADYVVAPAGKCHPVDDLALETALLAEPVSCVVHGLDVLGLRPGSDVLVFGAGTTGLILTQLLRQHGATRLTVAAPTEFKLELAAGFGADETVRVDRSAVEDSTKALRSIAPGGFDVVIDATGAPSVVAQCLQLVRDGGTVLFYGMTPESTELSIRPYEVFRRELTIKGSFAQAYSFDRALLALRTGRVRAEGLVTHRFGLADYARTLDAVAHDRTCIKAYLHS